MPAVKHYRLESHFKKDFQNIIRNLVDIQALKLASELCQNDELLQKFFIDTTMQAKFPQAKQHAADYVIEYKLESDYPFLKKQLEESFIRFYGKSNTWEMCEDFFKQNT